MPVASHKTLGGGRIYGVNSFEQPEVSINIANHLGVVLRTFSTVYHFDQKTLRNLLL